ncbi:MAG: aminotransferase class V-fold PLP-dependent enzyme [Cyclobacteriaceae bacterium]|nr:aminotransferase class V-fold PLP-dependent enzyme [Cyclobacteriaceae bacterium]
MNYLKEKILALQQISEKLEPTSLEREQYITQVNEYTNTFINDLENTNAYSNEIAPPHSFSLDGSKKSLQDILTLYSKGVATKGINAASGGHLGYIPGGGIYTSALADYIAAVTNEYAGMYFASPGAVSIENELIDWMKLIFGFPETAIGNLTSGGSIANLIALTAARDQHGIKSNTIPNSVIYLSPQVHHCIHKAIRILGLEDVIIRHLELDHHSRIRVDDLKLKIEKDLREGLNPFLVIASSGTTDTGAIDPLQAIGEIAKTNNLWYHIDGAYGGFFILTEQKKEQFKGIELADSLVIDPHKGLFLPYGLGAVLIKNKEAVYHSNHYQANYMQDAIDESMPVNPADVSPELTKHFRGLRLWIPLLLHGIEPFVACLEEKLLLTTYFRKRLTEIGFSIGPVPDLSVSYFWYSPKNSDENTYNENLMQEIHNDGEVFLSSTTINGKFVIRLAILSFRTKLTTIEKAIVMIEKARKKVENRMKRKTNQ